ncbi:quinolinate synthetase [Phaeovulum vinaykumarii]|uniref:Quinolinate synthase n=2 Tax=Phaeovulum vinaykumarii TaxID=407234 RepID=A0A1N7M8U9_9RHOB|nr:quinolinate synthetase [Phaeovulum vinaykumarii]SOC10884.1 quinolinate synthetase [Phaeovulum vinaykumarii]
MRATLAEAYDLAPDLALAERMADIHARMARVVPLADWALHAPYVAAINALKAERGAVILAHNYMRPEIYHGVADVVGDSLQLAIEATRVEAQVIVQAGVHFMAETSKVLNPAKTVLIPDTQAGCSLADAITPAGIAEMRARYPGAPVVSYVNTTAEVKAASDVCCTSSNAVQIVRAQEADTVIMTPDRYLAQNVAAQVPEKNVVWWDGSCIVHERFTAADLRSFREHAPDTRIIAHPECPPDVVAASDFAGSTAAIIDYVSTERPAAAMLLTECSMAANIADAVPGVDFRGPCNLCPYMQMITLEKILWSLHTMTHEVTVDPAVSEGARRAVERMIELSSAAK